VIVVVLTACPEGLRGHLTRWLMEVSAGVFVGHASRRVREELWSRVGELIGGGRALMVYSVPGEQGLALCSLGHHWVPEDFDGVTLMRRLPGETADPEGPGSGWSSVGRRRRYGRGQASD
jgi:CRISPR-associated protein Cas2